MASKFFAFALLFGLLISCNSKNDEQEEKLKKDVLFGELNKEHFENQFFNFQIDFNEDWELKTKFIQSVPFGGDMLHAKYTASYDEYYPINLSIEADKANPFGSKSPLEQLKESKEGYEMLFDPNEMIVDEFDLVKIAGNDFAHGFFTLISDSDTSFVNEYYRYHNGYFLTIICAYNTQNDEIVANDIVKAIRKKK